MLLLYLLRQGSLRRDVVVALLDLSSKGGALPGTHLAALHVVAIKDVGQGQEG